MTLASDSEAADSKREYKYLYLYKKLSCSHGINAQIPMYFIRPDARHKLESKLC